MPTKKINRVLHGLQGEIHIPGDKSISHRSMMLSGIATGTVRIENYLYAADCQSTMQGMRALGATVCELGNGTLEVTGVGREGLHESTSIIDAGDSGTMLRLMMGLLAPQPFLTTFTGDASLSRRPMGRVIAPLTQMGAHIVGRDENRLLPITIIPAKEKMHGITYSMPMASAQVKSAVLLAGLFADGETTVIEPATSRDHTERMLSAFGVQVRTQGTRVTVQPLTTMQAPAQIIVPGDISSAAFWLVAASLIPQSELILKNVGVNPTRTGILDVLLSMGADISLENERISGGEPLADLRVKTAKLRGVTLDDPALMPRLIDEIPILAVAALLADGDTKITGAGELRVKETDRLHAVAVEYNKLSPGAVEELQDGLIIHGQKAITSAETYSYDDHRIAMSLAIAGAAGDGIAIQNAECVDISYPTFYDTLQMLRK